MVVNPRRNPGQRSIEGQQDGYGRAWLVAALRAAELPHFPAAVAANVGIYGSLVGAPKVGCGVGSVGSVRIEKIRKGRAPAPMCHHSASAGMQRLSEAARTQFCSAPSATCQPIADRQAYENPTKAIDVGQSGVSVSPWTRADFVAVWLDDHAPTRPQHKR